MENKKKSGLVWGITSAVIVLCAVLVLYLTQSGILGGSKTASGEAVTFSLSVTVDGGEDVLYSEDVTAESGTALIDILSENVAEYGGIFYYYSDYGAYITKICGHSENPIESKYWVYTVNGEMAMSSASEYYPEAGDEIVFDLSVLEW